MRKFKFIWADTAEITVPPHRVVKVFDMEFASILSAVLGTTNTACLILDEDSLTK